MGYAGMTHADVSVRVDGVDEETLAWLRERLHVEVALRGEDDGAAQPVPQVTVTVVAGADCADCAGGIGGVGGAGRAAGGGDGGPGGVPVSTSAVIALNSTSHDAETLFRTAIVALDGIMGNQVEGISPLYHVSNFDGPDTMAAVMQLTTRMDARSLIGVLGDVASSLGGGLELALVDMDGVSEHDPDCRVPWPDARERAAVLAPWMDMDPAARLGRDPVSFLLAMAPDAGRVGMLSDNWILGGGR